MLLYKDVFGTYTIRLLSALFLSKSEVSVTATRVLQQLTQVNMT